MTEELKITAVARNKRWKPTVGIIIILMISIYMYGGPLFNTNSLTLTFPVDHRLPNAAAGFVSKNNNMPPLEAWHPNFTHYRWEKINNYHNQREEGSISLDTPPNLFAFPHKDGSGCKMYVNHKYKFIWTRTPKIATVSFLAFFGECNKNKNNINKPDNPWCLENVSSPSAQDIPTLTNPASMWQHYFVFGVTRNVWSRAVSSFQWLEGFIRNSPSCHNVTWNEFCSNPMATGDLCRHQPECCGRRKPGNDDDNGNINNSGSNNNIATITTTKKFSDSPQFHYYHIRSQTVCMMTDRDQWAVDYIARLETLDTDFPEIIEEINKRRDPSLPAIPVPKAAPKSHAGPHGECQDAAAEQLGMKRENNYCDRGLFYSGSHAECAEHIGRFYKEDLDRLRRVVKVVL